MAEPEDSSGDESISGQTLQFIENAERAFIERDYDEAIRQSTHALIDLPMNPLLLELISQAYFAKGEFREATIVLQQAMASGDPDDWGYVIKNYREYYRGTAYVEQMDKLVAYIKENPDAAYARFLRGYHYGFLGYNEAAKRELVRAITAEPKDEMAGQLLEKFGGTRPSVEQESEATPPEASPPEASPPEIVDEVELPKTEPDTDPSDVE